MKDLFWIFVFFVLIVYFFGDEKPKERIDDTLQFTQIDSSDEKPYVSENTPIEEKPYVPENTIRYPFKYFSVRSLGDVSEERLNLACQHLSKYFECDCYIEEGVPINDVMKIDNTEDYLNSQTTLDYLVSQFENSQIRTIFITDKFIWLNKTKLRGYTYSNGDVILVAAKNEFLRETLIHEMGHTLNLPHCQDMTCIMAVNNDEWDSGDFCRNCRNNLLQNLR